MGNNSLSHMAILHGPSLNIRMTKFCDQVSYRDWRQDENNI